jgi:hypothetical protein
VTTELALQWAQLSTTATPLYRARRLEVVRTFARHRRAQEPATEVPPKGILGPAHRRTQPYIYSNEEIGRPCIAATSGSTSSASDDLHDHQRGRPPLDTRLAERIRRSPHGGSRPQCHRH